MNNPPRTSRRFRFFQKSTVQHAESPWLQIESEEADTMCSDESVDSQVLAYLRRVALNRTDGQPVYDSVTFAKIVSHIEGGLEWKVSRVAIQKSLERLRDRGAIEVPGGFAALTCTIRLTKAVQPQLAS